ALSGEKFLRGETSRKIAGQSAEGSGQRKVRACRVGFRRQNHPAPAIHGAALGRVVAVATVGLRANRWARGRVDLQHRPRTGHLAHPQHGQAGPDGVRGTTQSVFS
ncbi:MAG: hypothetical protein ACK55I_45535, partial [bacterium]